MTSCGAQTSDQQGPSVSTPSSTSLSPAPAGSTPPQETCAAFLPSAPCAIYTSTSGTAGGTNLPWVASGSLRVQLNAVNGDLYLSVRTNCAPISGPVEITGNTMTARDLAIGAVGCPEELGRQDQWVLEVLKRPVEMSFSQDSLQWKSGADTLSFKSADS
ncbi:META domain-containing protein [Pseudarthrobacter sp. Y6]|uniref:META domain-containing protein n=1 Tax=Pseudarthrobacter sp. Y6 TaxID=3418422 RepID=UPI003CE8E785